MTGFPLQALSLSIERLIKIGEVHVVAPATVQSATGHGITLSVPLLTSRMTVADTFTGTAVEGRPADCVKLAVAQLLPRAPDLVVSGMNSGANSGINVVYSGTVAAAIEAAFLGLPSIAVSLHLSSEVETDYPRSTGYAAQTISRILKTGLAAGQVVSVNIPALKPKESPAGTRIVRQCTRPWIDTYERRHDPRGREYFWNNTVFTLGPSDNDTDVAALRDKYITITPLQFDLTDHALLKKWTAAEK